MSPRPLRQFYGHDRTLAIDGLGSPVEPFVRHRARFVDLLRDLSDDDWGAPTRCDAWNVKEVVQHLVSADGFWALTLAGRLRPEPSSYLRGFDPTATPAEIIAERRDDTASSTLAAFEASTASLTTALGDVEEGEWSKLSESPFGHVPVRVIAAHSLWDSWLHERDVVLPLGGDPVVESDELLTAAAFTLFVAGAQGGVLDDDEPVGDGPDAPLDAQLRFTDLGGAIALRIDCDVVVTFDGAMDGTTVGSAVEFVDALTGRRPAEEVFARFPADAAAQFQRARQVL